MRVYFAGKVSKADWRHEIVGHGLRSVDGTGDWLGQAVPFGDGWTYVGPFFVACDHGCSHQLGEHGITQEMCQPAYYNDHCSPVYDQGGRRPWDITNSEYAIDEDGYCEGGYNLDRARLFNKCVRSIMHADLVFAWLDDPTAYGTIWELGYAAGKGIEVAVGMPAYFDASDLWFPVYGAGQVFRGKNAVEAFNSAASMSRGRRLFARCESPIEQSLLPHLVDCVPHEAELHAQYQVNGYRLDFAIVGPRGKLAVECDGHAYHERTKEQARHDRSRDRRLQMAGWRVARFTGSEIHANARRCALEAVRLYHSAEAAK